MVTQIEFGAKLRAFRKSTGQNQETLAAIAGTTKGTISKWENGKMQPNLLDVLRITQHHGISIEDLLDLKKKRGN